MQLRVIIRHRPRSREAVLLERLVKNVDDTLCYGRQIMLAAERQNVENVRRIDMIESKIDRVLCEYAKHECTNIRPLFLGATPEDVVGRWRLCHPDGRISECVRDIGLDPDTVRRFWKGAQVGEQRKE